MFDEITSKLTNEGFRLCSEYTKLNGSAIHGIIGLDLSQRINNLRLIKCLGTTVWKISKSIIPFGEGSKFLNFNSNVKEELLAFEKVLNALPICNSYLIDSTLNPTVTYEDALQPFFSECSLLELMRAIDRLPVMKRK